MFTALITQPITRESETAHPPFSRGGSQRAIRNTDALQVAPIIDSSVEDEISHVCQLVAWFLVLLVLPAIMALFYIIMYPDTFMTIHS
jgi:hypothetical protein